MRPQNSLFIGAITVLIGGAAYIALKPETRINRLVFLSVGQGDCAVIQSDRFVALVDTGPRSARFDAGARVVLPKLRSLGIQHVDMIFLSHPDSDHIGGTESVLNRFPKAKVVISSQFREHPEIKKLISHCEVIWLKGSGNINSGSVSISYFCPVLQPRANDNDGSVFLKISLEGASCVFSGDAPMEVERQAITSRDWRADIMKAGHHGSRTSTSPEWLNAVKPSTVILSVGKNNRYGHPHRVTLDRIRVAHAEVMRTDRDGDITFLPTRHHFVLSTGH